MSDRSSAFLLSRTKHCVFASLLIYFTRVTIYSRLLFIIIIIIIYSLLLLVPKSKGNSRFKAFYETASGRRLQGCCGYHSKLRMGSRWVGQTVNLEHWLVYQPGVFFPEESVHRQAWLLLRVFAQPCSFFLEEKKEESFLVAMQWFMPRWASLF